MGYLEKEATSETMPRFLGKKMHLRIRTRGFAFTEALSEYIKRRIKFAVDRFDGRIRSISVRVADLNGPRGGDDKACIIELVLVPDGTVVIHETASEIHVAVDKACDRVGRSIGRLLKKARATRTTSVRSLKISDTETAA